MIEEYHFGSITIDGITYDEDVEVRWTPKESPNGDPTGQAVEVLSWQRPESHLIDVEHIERAVEQEPATIIIGTGEAGMAQVTEGALNFIRGKGIELIIDVTREAVKTFNVLKEESAEEEGEQAKVIALLHLTC